MPLNTVTVNAVPGQTPRWRADKRSFACGLLLLIGSVAGLAGLQYVMPASFDNPAGVSQAGLLYYRASISLSDSASLGVPAFVWAFRLLLVASWIGYSMILVAGFRSDIGLGGYTIPAVTAMALLMAILFPPSLSSDIFAYAGWGRMLAMHAWNPYVHTLADLAAVGDPAGLVAPVPASSTHGPVWLALVAALAALLRGGGLGIQILALKVLAGLSLVAAAISGREVVRVHNKHRADLTALAIGLNPLLLIEGPGSGHNDVLMIALALAGIACCHKQRPRVGYLLVGLSIGIKFVSAAVVPWLIIEEIRKQRRSEWLSSVVLATTLILAPSLAGVVAFGVQTNPLAGIKTVFDRQVAGIEDPATSRDSASPISHPAESTEQSALPRAAVLLLVYAALSVVVWRSTIPGRYLSCWALFCLTLAVVGAPVPFAWYMIWPLSAALVRWDKYGTLITGTCIVLSLFLLIQYTIPYAR